MICHADEFLQTFVCIHSPSEMRPTMGISSMSDMTVISQVLSSAVPELFDCQRATVNIDRQIYTYYGTGPVTTQGSNFGGHRAGRKRPGWARKPRKRG
jgi:hypothetical protein